MSKYPCPVTGKKDVYPSVTTIIGDCTPKNWGPPWGANCACDFILESLKLPQEVPLESALPVIIETARKEYRSVSQKALDIGSEVHDMIENYFKILITGKGKERKSRSDEANNAFSAFLIWADENDVKPIELEKNVYSDRWAGRLDFYGYFNDKLYIIDWKSSKAHYPDMRYQVAAYRWAKRMENYRVAYDIATNDHGKGETMSKGRSHLYSVNKIFQTMNPQGCGVLRLDKETGLPDFKDHSKSYERDLAVFRAMVDLYYLRHPRIRAKFLKNKEAT